MPKAKGYISSWYLSTPKECVWRVRRFRYSSAKKSSIYPYFIFFDVETWLKETSQSSHGKLHYSGSHELLSMSLIGSTETEPIFIPVESTAENALKLMIKEMNQISVKYISELYYTYKWAILSKNQ